MKRKVPKDNSYFCLSVLEDCSPASFASFMYYILFRVKVHVLSFDVTIDALCGMTCIFYSTRHKSWIYY